MAPISPIFIMAAALFILVPLARQIYYLYFKPYHMRISIDGEGNEVFFNVMTVLRSASVTRDDYQDDGTTIVMTVSARGRKRFRELRGELKRILYIEFEEAV